MGEEQIKILSMLKDGKVTVEEAERLLKLVGLEEKKARKSGEFTEFAREMPDALVRGMLEAFKAVGEVGRSVGKKGKELIDVGGDRIRKKYQERPFRVKLPEGVTEVKIGVEAKVGTMRIKGALDDTETLAKGIHKTISSDVVEYVANTDTPTRGSLLFESEAGSLEAELHPEIIYDLDVENAAGAVKLDLRYLRARSAEIENSLGMVSVKLGNLIEDVNLTINNSAGKVKLVVPSDAGLKISAYGQMGTHNLDEMELLRDGEDFVTSDFDNAQTKITVRLEQTVGLFRLKRS